MGGVYLFHMNNKSGHDFTNRCGRGHLFHMEQWVLNQNKKSRTLLQSGQRLYTESDSECRIEQGLDDSYK